MRVSVFKGLLAGMMISLGCTIFLKIGGIVGAILFSIGLLGVVTYQLNLFTGKAGFLELNWRGIREIGSILLLNVIGVFFTAFMIGHMTPDLVNECNSIIQKRIEFGLDRTFIASIFCGVMMSLAITGIWKYNNSIFIPLLFAVPCFILSGYYHCIADAFYFALSGFEIGDYWIVWIVTVAGNWVGCNLQRLIKC